MRRTFRALRLMWTALPATQLVGRRATTIRKPLQRTGVQHLPRALRDERRIDAVAENRQHVVMIRNLSRYARFGSCR